MKCWKFKINSNRQKIFFTPISTQVTELLTRFKSLHRSDSFFFIKKLLSWPILSKISLYSMQCVTLAWKRYVEWINPISLAQFLFQEEFLLAWLINRYARVRNFGSSFHIQLMKWHFLRFIPKTKFECFLRFRIKFVPCFRNLRFKFLTVLSTPFFDSFSRVQLVRVRFTRFKGCVSASHPLVRSFSCFQFKFTVPSSRENYQTIFSAKNFPGEKNIPEGSLDE